MPSVIPPKVEAKPGSAAAAHRFLLLRSGEWLLALGIGAALAAILLPFYRSISLWVGAALMLTGVVVAHLRYACRRIIPAPHFFLIIASVQYVFAAWASDSYPSSDPLTIIGKGLPHYLSYATLVLFACAIGVGVSMVKLPFSITDKVPIAPRLLATFDFLLVVGLAAALLRKLAQSGELHFVIVLLANLRYLGVFGRMVCKGPGWGWRLVLVLAMEILFASVLGMFGNVIIWGLWAMALWIYLFRPSWWSLCTAFVLCLVGLPALHASKWQLRDALFVERKLEAYETAPERSWLWLTYLGPSIGRTLTGNLDREFLGDFVARYNQGWIIDRVMQHVPEQRSFAQGKTLRDAVIASLLPRILVPDKASAGGKQNMADYAGIELTEGTSMNLGFAGEMYANFGYWGGIFGCGVYSLLIGLLFRWVAVRAVDSPFWWAVLPYIGFSVLKAEEDVLSVLNWVVKGSLFLGGICLLSPDLRHALFPRRQAPVRRRFGKQRQRDNSPVRRGQMIRASPRSRGNTQIEAKAKSES